MKAQPTTASALENKLVGDVTALIDYTSRVLGAVESGNWYYAWDKVREMSRVLNALEADFNLSKRELELRKVNAGNLWATVAQDSYHHWVGRAIFDQRFETAVAAIADQLLEHSRRRDRAALGDCTDTAMAQLDAQAEAVRACLEAVLAAGTPRLSGLPVEERRQIIHERVTAALSQARRRASAPSEVTE